MDGKRSEGSYRSHQVPLSDPRNDAGHLGQLEQWLKSYRPEELFDERGTLLDDVRALSPEGTQRMSASPHANGGAVLRYLALPDFRDYAVDVPEPGVGSAEATRALGAFLRDIVVANPTSFRLFGPDETASNRLGAVLEATNRAWAAEIQEGDDELRSTGGRVVEILPAPLPGLARGLPPDRATRAVQLLRGVHPHHRLDVQPAREVAEGDGRDPRRLPIASLNYLLTSHVWRQDHNGFSHQDPGFIDHVVNKKAGVIRVYLPPDANTLLSVADHCLRSRQYVNVILAGKQPALTYLSMEDAILHCTRGLGIWEWASTEGPDGPDVVLGCAGDAPTLEVLAAAAILREELPDLGVRVVNVVDLMRLQPKDEHPHGLPDSEFDAIFTTDRPVVFAYHGYPWLIHRLTYRRTNHGNLHVRGYKEEGTTTTPFDMVMLNDLDRFHLVMDVIDRTPGLGVRCARLRQRMVDERLRCRAYTREHGEDRPDVRDFTWPG